VERYWEELENDCRVSAGALQKIRSNRLDLLIRESAEGEEEAKDFQHLTHQLLSRLPRVTHSQTLHCSPSASPPRQDVYRQFAHYLQKRNEKRSFLQGLSREFVEKESAHRLYSFVRGGYVLDPSDVEGEFISLQRFNQAKEEFPTLGELYRSVLSHPHAPNGRPLDCSFGSLVSINELSGKLGPTQLMKVMKQSKVVR
jgi:hypothetical protein